MVGDACYPQTPDYTLYSGVHVCWSEHSDLSFIYGFMSLDYGLGTMTATTFFPEKRLDISCKFLPKSVFWEKYEKYQQLVMCLITCSPLSGNG